MNNEINNDAPILSSMTIGELIKAARNERKISLLELSGKTKIRVEQISKLEQNNFSKLPGRTYLLGFIKSIASYLEIDQEKCANCFAETYTKFENTQRKDNDNNASYEAKMVNSEIPLVYKEKRSLLFRFCIGSAVSISLLFIAGLLFFYNQIDFKKTKVAASNIEIKKNINLMPNKKMYQQNLKKAVAVADDKVIELSIFAKTGISWMAYKIDQKPIVQFTLKKGKSIFFRGNKIKILVGNYNSLEIKKNKKLFVAGNVNSDHTVSLVFPETLKNEKDGPLFVFDENGSVKINAKDKERTKI